MARRGRSDSPEEEGAAARLRMAFDLFEFGVELQREKIRREMPGIGDRELEVRIGEWLRIRPGAAQGDSPGRPITLERTGRR